MSYIIFFKEHYYAIISFHAVDLFLNYFMHNLSAKPGIYRLR
jgi:hypothetical protein